MKKDTLRCPDCSSGQIRTNKDGKRTCLKCGYTWYVEKENNK